MNTDMGDWRQFEIIFGIEFLALVSSLVYCLVLLCINAYNYFSWYCVLISFFAPFVCLLVSPSISLVSRESRFVCLFLVWMEWLRTYDEPSELVDIE